DPRLPRDRPRRGRPLRAVRHRRRDRDRPRTPLLRADAAAHRDRHLARRAPPPGGGAGRVGVLPRRQRGRARLGAAGGGALLRRLPRCAPQPDDVLAPGDAGLRRLSRVRGRAALDDGE
ncbi:MAG: hypothetical protein AVDCRST_MAG40-3279, partial [uncultured Gemmatimonadaceae bacterium]